MSKTPPQYKSAGMLQFPGLHRWIYQHLTRITVEWITPQCQRLFCGGSFTFTWSALTRFVLSICCTGSRSILIFVGCVHDFRYKLRTGEMSVHCCSYSSLCHVVGQNLWIKNESATKSINCDNGSMVGKIPAFLRQRYPFCSKRRIQSLCQQRDIKDTG